MYSIFLEEMFAGSMIDLVKWYAVFYFIVMLGFFIKKCLTIQKINDIIA